MTGFNRSTNVFPQNKNIFTFGKALRLIVQGGKHHKIQVNNPVLVESFPKLPDHEKQDALETLSHISKTSSAYIGKHGQKPKRMQSATVSQTSKIDSRFSKGVKTFYPKEYYKKVGYQFSDTSKGRVDALGQRVRERFNEELCYSEISKSRALEKKTLEQFETEKKMIK